MSCSLLPWVWHRMQPQARSHFFPCLVFSFLRQSPTHCLILQIPAQTSLKAVSLSYWSTSLFIYSDHTVSSFETLSTFISPWLFIALCLLKLDLRYVRVKAVSFAHHFVPTASMALGTWKLCFILDR